MKIIDFQTTSPEENLAMDEFFLAKAERLETGETLRFWKPVADFVVIGRSGKVDEECFVAQCAEDGIKILRRISGGAAVLESAGCLNYSAVLSYSRDAVFRSITGSYERIMADLVERFRGKGVDAEFLPYSDLAVGGRKFSGNAQARKKRYFLHHGTVLYGMDMSKVAKYLKHPPKEPEYRKRRSHGEFLTNISISAADAESVVREAFKCGNDHWRPDPSDLGGLRDLIERKYLSDSWNLCF